MKINQYHVAGILLLSGLAFNGLAAQSTANMQVSATVLSACTVETLPLMFKEYNPLSSKPLEAQSLLTVRCNNSLPYTIRMNAGLNASGKHYDYNNQAMTGSDPSQKLYYNIYTNPTHANIWGDGATNGSMAVSGIGSGEVTTIPFYGRILAKQKAAHAKYQDTVTITIVY